MHIFANFSRCYFQKNVCTEFDFLPADKHEKFLQVDSITLDVSIQACPEYPKQVCNIFVISEGKREGWSWFFGRRETPNVFSNWCYHFVWPGMPKLFKIATLLFIWNILREKWVIKLIFFLHADKHENLILWFFDEDGQPFPKFPRLLICTVFTISRKKLDMKLIFCMQINIKVSYKVIIPLLMGIIKHSQSTQSIKCAISQKRS